MAESFMGDTRANLPGRPGIRRVGGYVTVYGLAAFSSRAEYPTPAELTVPHSQHALHLAVWLCQGIEVNTAGRRFRVEGHDTVAGYLPGAPWHTDREGRAPHVGLLLAPDVLSSLVGEQGAVFVESLRRAGCLRVQPGNAAVLRCAHELDAVLLAPDSSALLREAKSLELLARLLETGTRQDHSGLSPSQRTRLDRARVLLLADLAHPPTIAELARACGLNTLQLKRGFKARFGLPVYAFYQRERMHAAWELIASGRMSATQAGHHLGYSNLSHFSAAFRKIHGIAPGELRRRSL